MSRAWRQKRFPRFVKNGDWVFGNLRKLCCCRAGGVELEVFADYDTVEMAANPIHGRISSVSAAFQPGYEAIEAGGSSQYQNPDPNYMDMVPIPGGIASAVAAAQSTNVCVKSAGEGTTVAVTVNPNGSCSVSPVAGAPPADPGVVLPGPLSSASLNPTSTYSVGPAGLPVLPYDVRHQLPPLEAPQIINVQAAPVEALTAYDTIESDFSAMAYAYNKATGAMLLGKIYINEEAQPKPIDQVPIGDPCSADGVIIKASGNQLYLVPASGLSFVYTLNGTLYSMKAEDTETATVALSLGASSFIIKMRE